MWKKCFFWKITLEKWNNSLNISESLHTDRLWCSANVALKNDSFHYSSCVGDTFIIKIRFKVMQKTIRKIDAYCHLWIHKRINLICSLVYGRVMSLHQLSHNIQANFLLVTTDIQKSIPAKRNVQMLLNFVNSMPLTAFVFSIYCISLFLLLLLFICLRNITNGFITE